MVVSRSFLGVVFILTTTTLDDLTVYAQYVRQTITHSVSGVCVSAMADGYYNFTDDSSHLFVAALYPASISTTGANSKKFLN